MAVSPIRLAHTMWRSNFLKHNIVFFVGSVAVGVLNYLYYPVMGRLMAPAQFGEVQVLVSLFLQFTIFLNVLSLVTVTIAVNYNDAARAHRMMFELEKLASYLAVGILGLSIIGGEFLRRQLQFDSMVPFVALALAMTASIPLTFRSAYARGQKKFAIASFSQLIGAGVKIIFSVGLVILGLGASGAVLGIVGAQLVAFLYAARWAYRLGFRRPRDTHYGTLPDLRLVAPELKYAGVTFLGLLTITLMMSVDVILAKYYFDPRTAGLYAGIATVARIAFFLAAPIAQVLMPLVKIDRPGQENRRLLAKSLGLTALVCSGVALACTLFPYVIVRVMMGGDYAAYAALLPRLTFAVCLIASVNLVSMYFLSLRRKTIVFVGMAGFALTLALMIAWHASPESLVNGMLAGSVVTAGATGLYAVANLKREQGNRYA
jgi:O-antigen/teichoic acid export membrane protein